MSGVDHRVISCPCRTLRDLQMHWAAVIHFLSLLKTRGRPRPRTKRSLPSRRKPNPKRDLVSHSGQPQPQHMLLVMKPQHRLTMCMLPWRSLMRTTSRWFGAFQVCCGHRVHAMGSTHTQWILSSDNGDPHSTKPYSQIKKYTFIYIYI